MQAFDFSKYHGKIWNLLPFHITPVLKSLHWLPVRIDFKVLLLIYKSLHEVGPKYRTDMLKQHSRARPLGSLGSGLPVMPKARPKQGKAAFSHYAVLPYGRRYAPTLIAFKSRLTISLFKHSLKLKFFFFFFFFIIIHVLLF